MMIVDPYRFGAANYVAEVMADSPVWFGRLNEASGTTATNLGSLGTNGTYSTHATTLHSSGGPISGGGYIEVGQPSASSQMPGLSLGIANNYNTTLTMELLFAPAASQPASLAHILSKNQYFATAFFNFPIALVIDSALKLTLRIDSGTDFVVNTQINYATALTAGNWYHIVCVYRGSGLCEIYLQGVQVASSTIAYNTPTNSDSWRVGSATDGGAGAALNTASGKYAEVALYSTALSSARIAAHFAKTGL